VKGLGAVTKSLPKGQLKPITFSFTVTTATYMTTSSSSPMDWPDEKILAVELLTLATGPAVWYECELKICSFVWYFKNMTLFVR